jgi:hypothetical protein
MEADKVLPRKGLRISIRRRKKILAVCSSLRSGQKPVPQEYEYETSDAVGALVLGFAHGCVSK